MASDDAAFQLLLDLYQKSIAPREVGAMGVATASIVALEVFEGKLPPRQTVPLGVLTAKPVLTALKEPLAVSTTSPAVPFHKPSSKRYSACLPVNSDDGYQRIAVPAV